jgi:hypothetical protein
MDRTHQEQAKRNPLRFLLWLSWLCIGWICLSMLIFLTTLDLPRFIQVGALFSGAVGLLGAFLALVFLVFAARDRHTLVRGIAALILNAGYCAYFVQYLRWP